MYPLDRDINSGRMGFPGADWQREAIETADVELSHKQLRQQYISFIVGDGPRSLPVSARPLPVIKRWTPRVSDEQFSFISAS